MLGHERGCAGTMVIDPHGTSLAVVDRMHGALQRRGVPAHATAVAYGSGALIDAVRLAAGLYQGGLPVIAAATTLGAAIERSVDPQARRGATVLPAPLAQLFVDYAEIARASKDGLGTLVRNAMIEGDEFFDGLETLAPHPLRKWPWESVIGDALRVDRMHHAEERDVLDLGWPLARAIVAMYAVAPQPALALGLRGACLIGRRVAGFDEREHLRVLAMLALLGFALHDTRIDAEAILAAIPSETRFTLPHKIGDVEAGLRVPRATLRTAIARLAHAPGAAEFR